MSRAARSRRREEHGENGRGMPLVALSQRGVHLGPLLTVLGVALPLGRSKGGASCSPPSLQQDQSPTYFSSFAGLLFELLHLSGGMGEGVRIWRVRWTNEPRDPLRAFSLKRQIPCVPLGFFWEDSTSPLRVAPRLGLGGDQGSALASQTPCSWFGELNLLLIRKLVHVLLRCCYVDVEGPKLDDGSARGCLGEQDPARLLSSC